MRPACAFATDRQIIRGIIRGRAAIRRHSKLFRGFSAPRGDGPADDSEHDRQYADAPEAGLGLHAGFGILTDPAAAKSRLPAGSYGWGGIYGTQFWIDPGRWPGHDPDGDYWLRPDLEPYP